MGKLDFLDDRKIYCAEFDIVCAGTTPCCQCEFIQARDADLIKEDEIQGPYANEILNERVRRMKGRGKA